MSLPDETRGTSSLVGLHRQMWHVVLFPNDQLVDSFIEQSLDGTLSECALHTACLTKCNCQKNWR